MSNISTNPKYNIVPEKPSGYILPRYVLPAPFVFDAEKARFAEEAHRKGLTLKEAEDGWDQTCRAIIRNNDTAIEQAERWKAEQYGGDIFMSPMEARAEIYRITKDKGHAFNDPLHPNHAEGQAYMIRCREIEQGQKTSFAGYLTEVDAARRQRQKENYGNRSSKSGGDTGSEKIPLPVIPQERQGEIVMPGEGGEDDSIGYGKKETKSGSGDRIEDALEGEEE